jgi:hypothetical protein
MDVTLVDHVRITGVVANLAHAQDDKNWARFRALFADRVTLDLTGRSGEPVEELTADELTEKARAIIDGFACTHHASSNLLIEVSGATTRCRAHMVAYHHVPTPGIDYLTASRAKELRLFYEIRRETALPGRGSHGAGQPANRAPRQCGEIADSLVATSRRSPSAERGPGPPARRAGRAGRA